MSPVNTPVRARSATSSRTSGTRTGTSARTSGARPNTSRATTAPTRERKLPAATPRTGKPRTGKPRPHGATALRTPASNARPGLGADVLRALRRTPARGAARPTSRKPGMRLAPWTPFVLLMCAILAAGLLGLLLLNTVLAQGAFVTSSLQTQNARLAEREAELSDYLAAQAAPARLGARAEKLGRVPAEASAFVNTADGSVRGVAKAAPAAPKAAAPKAAARATSQRPRANQRATTGTASEAQPAGADTADRRADAEEGQTSAQPGRR